jgi:co-chaperonin GroES (HSP10)|uniref:Co-chaperonin GroES n=2 Tax=uncultured virus TaxID=340016 RepID=A0A221S2K2_9VIRU|nr:co-chaperonin GroES [uncultured virus]
MIEVPGYLAKELEAEKKAKEAEAAKAEAEKEEGVDKMYVEPKARVLDPSKADKSMIDRMPNPTGWRMLILPYRGKAKTDGGIYIPDKILDDGQIQTVVGYVLKQGPLVYADTEKFPDGPWCKEKDWVVFARYAGSRFRIDGGEVRILNDDEILATIDDPEDIISF